MTELDDLDQAAKRAREAREALVGKRVAGRYVVHGILGHGGMGAVYEAERLGLGKRVAIKFIDPEFARDEKVVARFAREAQAMSAVESAHIVTVFDAGSEDGRPYLVMELLRGEDLGQRLRRERRVELSVVMHVAAQVLKGLARAHAVGIVHRDLKPDNIFLVKHDTDPLFAKIVDFGMSKIARPRVTTASLALTGRGTVLGTPLYMAPEQAQAASDVDGRADLYSVGAILFECLTGRPPHTGESYEQVILSICMNEAPLMSAFDPSIAPNVCAFVARALARDRTLRFPSAERMLAALHDVAPAERTRVPLELPSGPTLRSAGAPTLNATLLDGGAERERVPTVQHVGVATRLGTTLLSEQAEHEPGIPSRAMAEDTLARHPPVADASAKHSPTEGRLAVPRAKHRMPVGAAVITAAVATVTGLGVTLAAITLLDKKTTQPRPVPRTAYEAASATASAPATSSAPLPRVAPPRTQESVVMEPSGSPPLPATVSSPSGVVRHPVPARSVTVSRPSPSGKSLDIQRELP